MPAKRLRHTVVTKSRYCWYAPVLQGFFSKFLMGGTQIFWSLSVPDGDKVGWGEGLKKNPTEAKTAHLMQN